MTGGDAFMGYFDASFVSWPRRSQSGQALMVIATQSKAFSKSNFITNVQNGWMLIRRLC